jgi:hypothetical protein
MPSYVMFFLYSNYFIVFAVKKDIGKYFRLIIVYTIYLSYYKK